MGVDKTIVVIGAREHNLKGFDVQIPLGLITCISGVSGAGKSSLAFDTLYAEGQRRYVETFSTYARQFLERMDPPKVERIEGIPPAIAIEQGGAVVTSRSTVGSLTELTDYIKLLFARLSVLTCRGCGREVRRYTAEGIWEALSPLLGATVLITAPFTIQGASAEERKEALLGLGLHRIFINGETIPVEGIAEIGGVPEVVVDRLVLSLEERGRAIDSLAYGLELGGGRVAVHRDGDPPLLFSSHLSCPYCGSEYQDPNPNLFSFNSPIGACAQCRGFGRVIDVDPDLVVPDKERSIRQGAIRPWGTRGRQEFADLVAFCRRRGIPLDKPFKELTDRQREAIFDGDEGFYGVRGFFRWLESKRYKLHVRVFLSRYRGYFPCPVCKGSRFQPEALQWKLNGKDIAEVLGMSVAEAHDFFRGLCHPAGDEATGLLLREITKRLGYLMEVGLSYLTLDRPSRTLSGGELQRVRLTKALGSSLVEALYILDEPTSGLHPRDTQRLLKAIADLRDQGNTVVVVEHDPQVIQGVDYSIDLGPGGGDEGGELLYAGPTAGLVDADRSLTGRYLKGILGIPTPRSRRTPQGVIRVLGACEHNLKGIDVDIPLGVMTCITGVSGSGKSTLAEEVIYKGVKMAIGSPEGRPGKFRAIEGAGQIRDVILVDQRPIVKTSRGNPLTYLKAYDQIRRLYAEQPLAKARGYSPGAFSFNTPGGRCEVCRGDGVQKVEMQFLPDVYISCPVCRGRRFQQEVLEVTYKGKGIDAVLEMTASEAMAFFEETERITKTLSPLIRVGLGYLRLGQPLSTLSGGEAQRLKLAKGLAEGKRGILFVLDEPTIGLHPADIKTLLEAFAQVIEEGNTLVVVEHNLEVIKCADHIVDLGPEGGEEGGYVVVAGTPQQVAACNDSHTGVYLRRQLGGALSISPTAQRPIAAGGDVISIRGAREHNLKGIDIDIPRGSLVAITGVSGSGKSTLAFDICFAEGQGRYLESLSSYIRQYLKVRERPHVHLVAGVPPAVAIEQRTSMGGRRSTVATMTEIYHYLRLLYSRVGIQHCSHCGSTVSAQSPEGIAEAILRSHQGEEVVILAPVVLGRKGHHAEIIAAARRGGYKEARIDGKITPLNPPPRLGRYQAHDIDIVVARRELRGDDQGELAEVIEKGLSLGKGTIQLLASGDEQVFSTSRFCPRCQIGFEELDPRLFSFNSRYGACPQCDGLGLVHTFAPELVVPDPKRPLGAGAIAPLEEDGLKGYKKGVIQKIKGLGIPLEIPWGRLGGRRQKQVLYGGDGFAGVIPMLEGLRCQGDGMEDQLLPFMREEVCPRCKGKRLKESSLAVKVKGWGIGELVALTADEAASVLRGFRFDARELAIAHGIIAEVLERLGFLREVGLSYLALDRRGETLSGGEAQRLRLAAQLGSNLRGVCYIFDEPTIGLHPRDTQRLLAAIKRLKEKGNTILVVEHDEETIRSADYIIDLGPGGGGKGGRVVASGSLEEISGAAGSITSRYLNRRKEVTSKLRPGKGWLWVLGARGNNLKGIDVGIPLGTLTCITGVSGSGKSTLLRDTIYCGLKKLLYEAEERVAPHTAIKGWEVLRKVMEVDHTPIGRTPRSTPATYIGVFDEIRRLFSLVPEARVRGWGPGRFSFNVRGGRCEVCGGQGTIGVEMQFLPDVYVRCEVCEGRRYDEETLSIRYKGKDIYQVLEMTFEEGVDFFAAIPKIRSTAQMMVDMGLGYLTFGQPSPTLSGGEAQRIKLVAELSRDTRGGGFYVLDEPTTGLHMADIGRLLGVLQRLVDRGDTVAVIEHNLDVIKEADYIIDLGPEGGDRGGRICAQGTPFDILSLESSSYTAAALKRYLDGGGKNPIYVTDQARN